MNEIKTKSANILCVGNSWFPHMSGGLNRYVYELIHNLADNGDRIQLCGIDLPENYPNPSISFVNLASPNSSLLKRLRSTRSNFLNSEIVTPDAINLHFALYSFPIISSLPENIPITFTFHGPWAFEGEKEGNNKLSVYFKQWLEQRVYNKCDRFIVLSKAFGKILQQNYDICESKIKVIPGGVDIEKFKPKLSQQQAREKLNFPIDRPIIFTPRRLVRRMGIENLLVALAEVKTTIPDIWLAIAGKGVLRAELERRSRELNLEKQVKFLGFLPDEDLPIAYQAANLTVIPSKYLEGFGLILLESLACGTPVICTPVGGMPEILNDFSPQLIGESTESKAIANLLKTALKGEISLPTREACRNYVINNYNWKEIAERIRKFLLTQG
ncbi:MAG: glycosyltransferase family 4 protein [Prochloraceae cyanobacterium]